MYHESLGDVPSMLIEICGLAEMSSVACLLLLSTACCVGGCSALRCAIRNSQEMLSGKHHLVRVRVRGRVRVGLRVRVGVGVGVGVRVRVRVTELVYQIGFTTPC